MDAPRPPWLIEAGHGIFIVDTGFHRDRFDAAYLMVHGGRAAFIDTGTNFAVPRLLAALDALGVARAAVDWVIPTHVHLDHAGGAGLLMQSLPNAALLVHPRGAPHLIDPTRLYDGALAVYGQAEMDRSYGRLVAADPERVRHSHDEMVVHLAGRPLRLIDTPGHARHHHCVWDAASQGWFTGDTFGLSYPEFETAQGAWILPTSTPVQFDPIPLRASVQRLLAARPQCMFLTHFGRVTDVERLARLQLDLMDASVALARSLPPGPGRHAALKQGLRELYLASLVRHGCEGPAERLGDLLAMDIELNAQGIAVWLDRDASVAS